MSVKTENSVIPLDDGLNLSQLITSGSILHINECYQDHEDFQEKSQSETYENDYIGQPVRCFADVANQFLPLNGDELIKKQIKQEGGGQSLHEGCTVNIAYSGFWEDQLEPFDYRTLHKPMVVDLKENDLLPGLQRAIKSMLVGEQAAFIISYKLMFGELGMPPKIKPKSDCIFYITLIKSILTPKDGIINFSETNIFQKVIHQVTLLYSSGITLFKSKNYFAALQLFRKGVYMLHKCRLADESEEKVQEKLLIKLYTNLAIGYIKIRQPLKACVACNELHRLRNIWSNSKALYLNAKALRMIGQFDVAEKKLNRAMKLCPENKEIDNEIKLLNITRESCNQNVLLTQHTIDSSINESFKQEVDKLIKKFKEEDNLCKLTLPSGLNLTEIDYIKEACAKEYLVFTKIQDDFALDKDTVSICESLSLQDI